MGAVAHLCPIQLPRLAMLVSDVMTTKLVTVDMDTSVGQLKQLFEVHRFHHLIVVNHHQLVGVISDRDLLRHISPFVGHATTERPQDLSLLNRRAHQVMSRKPVALSRTASIQEAATMMLDQKISCIPIVDEHQIPIGVVCSKDLLRALVMQNEVGLQQE